MIAESPISDARAKSEARRAKILAREAARIRAAKGDTSLQEGNNETAVTAENEDEEPKGKERPLAARRNLVRKATDESELKVASAPTNIDSKDSDGNDVDATIPASAAAAVATIKITSSRTREIEKEIAMNNASFDKSIEEKPKEATVPKAIVKKQIKEVPTPLQPFQIMRAVRLTIIVLLAAATGYRSALKNMDEIVSFHENQLELKTENSDSLLSNQNQLHNFLHKPTKPSIIGVPDFYGNKKPSSLAVGNRTWFEWVQFKIQAVAESSISAVAVVWWVSSIIHPFCTKALPSSKKGPNLMNMAISFYNNGFEGMLDSLLSRVGEVCVHFVVMVAVPIVLTHLQIANGTSESSGTRQEL